MQHLSCLLAHAIVLPLRPYFGSSPGYREGRVIDQSVCSLDGNRLTNHPTDAEEGGKERGKEGGKEGSAGAYPINCSLGDEGS